MDNSTGITDVSISDGLNNNIAAVNDPSNSDNIVLVGCYGNPLFL